MYKHLLKRNEVNLQAISVTKASLYVAALIPVEYSSRFLNKIVDMFEHDKIFTSKTFQSRANALSIELLGRNIDQKHIILTEFLKIIGIIITEYEESRNLRFLRELQPSDHL